MADQRSAGAVSEHSIKSSSHVESEHRIRASKKQGQIVKMHLLFGHIEGVSYKLEVSAYLCLFLYSTSQGKNLQMVFPFYRE